MSLLFTNICEKCIVMADISVSVIQSNGLYLTTIIGYTNTINI